MSFDTRGVGTRLSLISTPLLFVAATIALSGAGAAATHRPGKAVTPASVGRMLDRYGAKRTVEMLARAGSNHQGLGDYDKVLAGVASGDARWLALVPRLDPGTDAATAESLTVSVAQALPKNPTAVLRLIARKSAWVSACSYPMIEPTAQETGRYFRAAVPAVRSVRAPALRTAKTKCLAALSKAQR